MKFDKIVSLLSLPKEIIYNLPYITIIGKEKFIIENYISIVEYTKTKTRIKTSCGIITIIGSGLILKEISKDEIVIYGNINKWEYV